MATDTQLQDEPVWRKAIECGELGVWDLRPLLETVHHSPQWKERLGFPNVREADSTDFWRCRVHPDDLGGMLDALHAHTHGGSPTYEATFRLRSNGSGYRLLQSRGRVVERDAQGRVVRMVGTMIDLTERPSSPRGGVVSGARSGTAVQPLAHPFHLLLQARPHTASVPASAIGAVMDDMHEQVLILVEDLLNASVGQLQRIAVADR